MMKLKRERTVLGFSGGVDSTAAALLLEGLGHEVICVFLDVTGRGEHGAAAEAARQLGFRLITMDVSSDFAGAVIRDFGDEYRRGRTPNPCVLCNPAIKFKHLLKAADMEGAQRIATGHYAGVVFDESEGRHFICKGACARKDQSYVLYRLGQEALSRLMLPLARFESKQEVRELVKGRGICSAEAGDSQEICFVPHNMNYVDYLESLGHPCIRGNFIDMNGEVMGVHDGIWSYTVGQRKHLGKSFGKPMHVVRISGETGDVTLGDEDDLMSTEVISLSNVFVSEGIDSMKVMAKVRYGAAASEATVRTGEAGAVRTVFAKPQRAVAPGQSIVFYDGERVIGGGIISKAL